MKSWKELLDSNSDRLDYMNKKIYVLCCQNKDSLNEFLTEMWNIQDHEKIMKLEPLGFFTKEMIHQDQNYQLSIYYTKLPLNPQNLQYLNVFLQTQDSTKIKWIWLLDWLRDEKKYWLRNLVKSSKQLESVQVSITKGNSIVVMLNSSNVQQLERNTMLWNSRRLDFVHQSIRATCLIAGYSLVTYDPVSIPIYIKSAIRSLIEDHDTPTIEPEMASLHCLYIPCGSDSVGKICTVASDFPVDTVFDDEFISSAYEATIASNSQTTIQSSKIFDNEDPEEPYESFNLQGRLATLHKQLDYTNKTLSSTQHKFYKPKAIDYSYEFHF